MYQKLIELKKDGTLKHLVTAGLMSSKVFMYLDIYMWVDAKEKTTTLSTNKIVTDASVVFYCSRNTIWKALRALRITINPGKYHAQGILKVELVRLY